MQHAFTIPPFTPSSLMSAMTQGTPFNIPQNNESQNQIAGPSTTSNTLGTPVSSITPQQRKRPSGTNSKKRRLPADGDNTDSNGQSSKTRDGTKKKKAVRACFHCQKAHLTCDDSRPCQRCIKRGIGDSCIEGHRKKAKYLLEENELAALKRAKEAASMNADVIESISANFQTRHDGMPENAAEDHLLENNPLFNLSFDPNYSFGSEAANLEYSILSAILGNPNHDQPHLPPNSTLSNQTPYASQFANAAWPAEPPETQPASFSVTSLINQQQGVNVSASNSNLFDRPSVYSPMGLQQQPTPPIQPEFASFSSPPISYSPSQQSQLQQDQYREVIQPTQQIHLIRPSIPMPTVASTSHRASPITQPSPASTHSYSDSLNTGRLDIHCRTSHEVYDAVTKAYDYTEGYHFLMKFLSARFEKNDILRVVRALAIFRPSLIALQTPLSEEDEVFVEKCFQRTLKELDKLISYSGTPTVVWRRTGEICLVGPEFCLLSEWSKDDLVNGRKYIYELFENQSVVEYWEKFASHAFENTTQSVYSHCVLLKPSGEPIPCTFCFSIRRDIFDLPSVVIGQWLPLF